MEHSLVIIVVTDKLEDNVVAPVDEAFVVAPVDEATIVELAVEFKLIRVLLILLLLMKLPKDPAVLLIVNVVAEEERSRTIGITAPIVAATATAANTAKMILNNVVRTKLVL